MDEIILCALCGHQIINKEVVKVDSKSSLPESLIFCSVGCLEGAEEIISDIKFQSPNDCINCGKEIGSQETYRIDTILCKEFKSHKTCLPYGNSFILGLGPDLAIGNTNKTV